MKQIDTSAVPSSTGRQRLSTDMYPSPTRTEAPTTVVEERNAAIIGT